MKKITCLTLVLLLALSLVLLSGCSALMPRKQPQTLHSYPEDTAPSQVIKTEDRWILLHNEYGSSDYRISMGESLDPDSYIYSVSDVSIWYFDANDKGIVWCEKSEKFYTYKAYVFENGKVETIIQTATDKGYQPQNIGIFGNNAYYCVIDYDQQTVHVLAYDVTTKTSTAIHTEAFSEKNQPYSINAEGEYLSFVCSEQVTVLNLQNNQTVFDSALPDAVDVVFTVSYDSVNDTCALYYADSDSEDIGIFKEGDGSIASVFTFSKNHYAYQDTIECYDGHIYWISQANVSGMITDHYQLVDYDYVKHKPVETERTFSFHRNGKDLYILRFNQSGDYTHVKLCQY